MIADPARLRGLDLAVLADGAEVAEVAEVAENHGGRPRGRA